MIIKLFLSGALLLILLYAFTQTAKSSFVSLVTVCCAVPGLYFVWFPEHANALARILEIGRGADLIFYVWIVISAAILLNLHFKIRISLEVMTTVVRANAINDAEREMQLKDKRRPDDAQRLLAPEDGML